MQPLVSILIPCYNAEAWLAETLESAIAQTWKNTEIIVVDDGSSDQSLAIARSYESQRVKVIHQTNQGASKARNVAYQVCNGTYIQYLDADDQLAPDKIERQLAQLQDAPESIASCEWARFYHQPEEAEFVPQLIWQDLNSVDFLVTAWKNHLMMHPAAWLVPRSVAERAGGWNEELSLNDDGEYFARVVLASRGIKFCWGARTYYRSGNTDSLSGSKSYKAWQSAFHALISGTQNLLAHEDSSRSRQVCADVFQRFIYEIYPDAPDLQRKAMAMVQQYGGSTLLPTGSSSFQLLSRFVGWKIAKQAQNYLYQWGYRQFRLNQIIAQKQMQSHL